MLPATYFTNLNLYYLLACRIVNVSMEYGVNGASANAYAFCGLNIVGSVFHRYRESFRFAKLAFDLVEKHGFLTYRAKVLLAMGMASFWSQPITTAINFMRAAYRDAVETGDLIFVCFSVYQIVAGLFLRNDPLDAVWRESEMALDFARQAKYDDVLDIIVSQQRFIANMQGRTATFSTFSDAQFDEAAFEAQMMVGRTSTMICWYWILKLKARFLSCDYAAALEAADKIRALLWASATSIHLLDYYYYAALTVAALYENAAADEQQAWRELLTAHRKQLREWAENYPPTFGDKHALVSAEIARLEGRDADAMRLYEQAIQSARKHGFVQNEGLAYELAARFYEARGVDSIAHAYLRNARYGYLRWGADGKVGQLDRLHPHLSAAEGIRPTAITGSTAQQLDVASIVKASQALSTEIELPKLIERLMTIALENAGADRGLLVLPAGEDYLIRAQGQTTGDQVEVVLRQTPITRLTCPDSLLRYVIRTRESVIISDASRPNPFSEDDYLRSRQPKSILCLPLIKQGRLTGLLYLENTLTSHAFTADRTAVLELLAAQAAISLENTRLYSDLQEREAKVRRLVDSNIIGIYIWDFQGRIIDANEAFLDMIGYGREDLISGRLNYPGLTPAEWNDVSRLHWEAAKTTGTSNVYEKEYLRKDGSRVPILLAGATFGEGQEQGVAFVLDLTERKRAEEKLLESERRYGEAQAELAHVNRVTTMGQLTASIAHEINQPLAGIASNGAAGLNWLNRKKPDLDQARDAFSRIVRDSARASDVIRGMRAFAKKSEPQLARLDIDEVIREVLGLARGELRHYAVVLHTDFAAGDRPVLGDRVQLQQVLLNLIMNGVEAMSGVTERARELTVSSALAEPGSVLISVEDTGAGLDPTVAQRIFEPFFTTKSEGLGMGLSICRSIVEGHRGRLWTSPRAPHGAAIHFTIPIELA
jgi:PAS domain S-box-containing protein